MNPEDDDYDDEDIMDDENEEGSEASEVAMSSDYLKMQFQKLS